MKIKAHEISLLKPGTRVFINGTTYIKMEDAPYCHVEDSIFNPDTGRWCSWARWVMWDDEVEIPDDIKGE